MNDRTKIVGAALAAFVCALPAWAGIVREDVEYDLPGGETARGVMVYDDTLDEMQPRPGVLVVPEWWGLTEYPITRAEELAEKGYIAFVADMYGGRETTDDPQQAGQLAGEAKQAGLAELAGAGLEQLRDSDLVSDKVFAIGFCFGGSTVAELVKTGADIDGAVSFHGGLSGDAAPTEEGEYPPLLVAHGGADPMVPSGGMAEFVRKSIDAGVPLTLVNFPGAVHAFTNPDADEKNMDGVAYDERAANLSMQIMFAFFDILKD